MYFGELLGGEGIGVYPGPVGWAVHVVKDGPVEVGGCVVELVVHVVVDEFGEGRLGKVVGVGGPSCPGGFWVVGW